MSGNSFCWTSKSSVPAGASARSVLATGSSLQEARIARRARRPIVSDRECVSSQRRVAGSSETPGISDHMSWFRCRPVHQICSPYETKPLDSAVSDGAHLLSEVDVRDPSLLRLRDRADGLRDRREGRQGPRRARLVAPAARQALGPVPRLDPQDREVGDDPDDHEPDEGRRRPRQERRPLHRGVRRAAAGDRRAPRRAHAAAHLQGGARPQQHRGALRAVLRCGRGGRRRAVGRQRAAADDPPRRGARAAARGDDALHDRRGRLPPRGGRLDPLPHRLSALVGQPVRSPRAGDLAGDPVLVDGSGAVRIVIAFGGNALIREHERGTWTEQTEHALEAAAAVARVARAHQVVLTHGNGPQVGALALQQAGGEPDAPALPFDVLDAMTQGEIGYLLQQALAAVDPSLPTATILTRVRVNPDDPALSDAPTKPIGPFYDEATARRLAAERGWHVAPDAGRGWRRMMASPRPVEILEEREIRVLAAAGVVVIAAGGGSIPVV